MSDSPELAAIRRRMMAGWPVDTDPFKDRIALLRILDEALKERDEAREGDEESSKLMAHYRDHCLRLEKERDEARATLKHREELDCFTKPLSCATHGLVVNLASFGNQCAECQRDALVAENERLREAMERGSDG